jgi:hypothetical protein
MMWRKVLGGACLAAVFGLLAGCGGSSTTAAGTAGSSQTSGGGSGQTTGSGGGTPPAIQGIATPSAVSVVTATNSN